MKTTQLSFANASDEFKDYWKKSGRKVHGGEHARGLRKTARPFHSKKPIHLVLRSNIAQGALSLRAKRNREYIQATVSKFAQRFHITLYEFSINGNHLHLLVRAKERVLFNKFLRTITGLIARFVLKAKKGEAKGKFWSALAFTRIGEWGRAYRQVKDYVIQNILEAAGVIPYTPRKQKRVNSS